eukprot:TRINITY_DN28809_c0_g1_i2.p1 TRINITY_DN28809_c0_g1~~TRINITY_DN28809_c0_g1_i2.p1  ORF type:complete len:337 (+),score=49.15 TRINITY_DN28809_c0_g1_i2:44-1054(+)
MNTNLGSIKEDDLVVVGCGVVGITTALFLQERFPNSQVKIVSGKLSPETISDVAAGIFRWTMRTPPEYESKWPQEAWAWFQNLYKESPLKTGVSKLPALFFSSYSSEQCESKVMKSVCQVYRKCTPAELNLPQPAGKFKHGIYLHTLQIDTGTYIKYLTDKFMFRGGTIIQAEIESFDEIGSKYIINCTGLGSRKLAGDREVLPIRGQVLKVEAPWIKTAMYADDVYIIPGQKYITIGGTRQYNDWHTDPEPHDTARIWDRACATFPCISKAKIVDVKVGLRPHRRHPRVEKEESNGKFIFHNYGHCSWGIMSSPATSKQVVDLVAEHFNSNKSKL